MTSKERVSAAFAHRAADRTPIFEYVILGKIGSRILKKKYRFFDGEGGDWYGYVKEIGFEPSLREYVRNKVALCKALGHDLMYLVPNPVLGGKRVSINVLEEGCFDTDNPEEIVRLRNNQRKEALQKNLLEPDDSFLVYEFINEEMKRQETELDIFAPDYFHGVWTDTAIMETMLLNEELAYEHFAICTEIALLRLHKLKDFGIRLVGLGGDFSGTRPLISPACYRKYIVPEVKKCADSAHRKGMWTVNASDGDLWSVIDDFLIGTASDAYMEIDAAAGMDLRRLKKEYGDQITFMGNMDCGSVLSFASPEEIAKLTIECLKAGEGNGGHIFTASNAITDSVPIENYFAMVNAYRDYFNMQRLTI